MQLASLTGLNGINFILAWSGPVGSDVLVNWLSIDARQTNTVDASDDDPEDHVSSTDDILTTQNNRTQRRPNFTVPAIFTSLFIYLMTIFLVTSYGSIRMSTALIPFYQQNISLFAPSSLLNVGCVIRQNQVVPDNSVYIQATRELAKNGTNIILWSEGAGTITNKSELDDIISTIKNISRTYNVYVGIAYVLLGESRENSFNQLTVISSSGGVVIDYKKSHLVPFMETIRFSRGKTELQTYDSKEYGVIGGAICFDYNFPGFIGQASSKKVNLMLEPSNTWVCCVFYVYINLINDYSIRLYLIINKLKIIIHISC